jgi:hypothetical protein
MLTIAPKTLDAWMQAIHDADIPVLAQTALAIEAMHEHEDDIAQVACLRRPAPTRAGGNRH